ncbi:MAG TPA: hypothetical protein VEC16_07095 [Alphaproteobacteria bacterium]|nr:hypothetical protein [Alphaproteobacteria bacterium]
MLQNIPKEKILEVVSQGPTLPAKIVKQVGGDTMIIGAILSTIITTGKIRVSSLKVGGSPLYYIPDHESRLEDYIEHLNEKDRRTFVMLKDQKVVRDESQDALTRFSLKTIRDFAKPFYIEHSGIKVLFWRFYNVPVEQAELIAQKIVQKPILQEKAPVVSPIISEVKSGEKPSEPEAPKIHSPEPIPASKVIDEALSKAAHEIVPEAVQEHKEIHSAPAVHSEIPKELSQDTHEEHKTHHTRTHSTSHTHQAEHAHESHPRVHKEHVEHKQAEHKTSEHKEAKEKIPKAKPARDPNKKDFYEVILNFITTNGLDLLSKEKLKKTEYNLILKNHNTNEYIFCKAKDKTTITDADLAPALIFAQNKKMPCLFLSTGALSQKTQAMMNNEFSGMMFKQIQ